MLKGHTLTGCPFFMPVLCHFRYLFFITKTKKASPYKSPSFIEQYNYLNK